jgi:hypothetical protein
MTRATTTIAIIISSSNKYSYMLLSCGNDCVVKSGNFFVFICWGDYGEVSFCRNIIPGVQCFCYGQRQAGYRNYFVSSKFRSHSCTSVELYAMETFAMRIPRHNWPNYARGYQYYMNTTLLQPPPLWWMGRNILISSINIYFKMATNKIHSVLDCALTTAEAHWHISCEVRTSSTYKK